MSTNSIVRCSILALTCAAGVHAAGAADIRFAGEAHFVAKQQYDSRTGQSSLLSLVESSTLTGVWHSVLSSGSEVYVSHHSVVLPDAISIDLRSNSYRNYLGEPGQSDYIDTYGESLFFLEFEVLNTIPHPVFVSGGAEIRLNRFDPLPTQWVLTGSTTLPDLIPGYYAFDAVAVAGSSQIGTLYLPSPGAFMLTGPLALVAARRRR